MTTPILVLSEETPIREAAELQLKMRIHSLPVVDAAGMLVGMVEDAALLALDASSQIWNSPARDFMTHGVVHYDQSILARTVYEFLCRLTVRRVVIVDDGKPVGIVSRGNILRWLGNWGELRRNISLSDLDQIRAGNLGRARSAALSTAAGMAKQAWSLYESLRKPDADFVPCVVDNASRIQSLVTDLLAGTQLHYSFAPLDPDLLEASG
jgi:two-component system cell cycle response regulator